MRARARPLILRTVFQILFRISQSNAPFVLLYAVSLLFPSLLTQYLFSACAIQPDLHVIRTLRAEVTFSRYELVCEK